METLRIVNTEGSSGFVERVVPVAPITIECERHHPGMGARNRASFLWIVKDGSGRTLWAGEHKSLALRMMRDAQMVIQANEFIAHKDQA